jgi:hypothetical protein
VCTYWLLRCWESIFLNETRTGLARFDVGKDCIATDQLGKDDGGRADNIISDWLIKLDEELVAFANRDENRGCDLNLGVMAISSDWKCGISGNKRQL